MSIKKIHLIAACGTGMGTLACMLQEAGYEVSGSDQNVYPPMSDFLKEKGIKLFKGFYCDNIAYKPDLVVIGNAVTKENVEAKMVLDQNIPYLSMPQALNKFFASRKKIILVTGTHGKTTTASIMAYLLYEAGYDPSFMIGGILKNFNSSYHIGKGEYFVIEGDEYDTAFFDKGPKFLHYDPIITINTGIEFDHADIFENLDNIKQVFKNLLKKLHPDTLLVAFNENKTLNDILKFTDCRIEKYGKNGNDWSFKNYAVNFNKAFFEIKTPENEMIPIKTSLMGHHNIMNTLAVVCAAKNLGISNNILKSALEKFSGIKRRQEVRGVVNGITVMDDFAHHPSAVKETISAVKPFYKQGRIIAVFEPGTNTSMRDIFQSIYPDSFVKADIVCIKEPSGIAKIPAKERMSAKKLVNDIAAKDIKALHFQNTGLIVDFLSKEAKQGDLILVMSNKGFDNIHSKILDSLL
ncbi:MAG: UDP-N-acetylmuramate:L-alanyl-gamma-D-glutamyl-meso-diaminopimelate ligase [Desulfobacteraceae bacterium]|nr:UDP-N-acetylmuramate:L-alanyl-gamma-D-glutamyl-meso-diaminopimelate ligase [Desulfobacteraceae bacterium]